MEMNNPKDQLEEEYNSDTFHYNLLDELKNNQNDFTKGSSNCNFPRINSGVHCANNENNQLDTFITDKIKDVRLREEKSDYADISSTLNMLKPYCFNQVCIDLDEQQANKPKSINPLFFVINGERTIDKDKYQINPFNYKTSSSLQINPKDHYMKYIQKQYDQLQERKLLSCYHESVKTATFVNCFNKSMKDKSKIKTDWKKVIFNNQKDKYETKVNLIRDIIKTEMSNRSIGKGIFNTNLKLRNRKKSKRKENVSEKEMESTSRPLVIDLQKKKCFGNKPLNRTGEVFFNRNFLRLTFASYQSQKEEKVIEKKKTEEMNLDLQKIYNNGIDSKIEVSLLKNKALISKMT